MNWKRAAIGTGVALPVVALLAFGLTRDPKNFPSPLPGREAPGFALQVMDSPADTVRLSAHRGEVVVMNFWASWCLECRYEHADLSSVASAYADRGVRFYGVLYDDTEQNGREWITAMGGQSYPSLLDPGMRTAIAYGLYGVPETFIIDRTGRVVHKQIGPITADALSALLEPLMASSPGTDPG